MLFEMTRRHARVAVYLGVIAEALLLKLSRSDNALANRSGCYRKKCDFAAASRDLKEAMRLSPKDAFAFNSRSVLKGMDSFNLATTNLGNAVAPKRDFSTTNIIPLLQNNTVPRFDPVPLESGNFGHDRDVASTVDDHQNIDNKRGSSFDSASQESKGMDRSRPGYGLTFGDRLNRGPSVDSFIESWTQLIRLNPKNADAFYERGRNYRKKGDYDHAIQDFTEAIRLKPDFPGAQRNLEETKKEKAEAK